MRVNHFVFRSLSTIALCVVGFLVLLTTNNAPSLYVAAQYSLNPQATQKPSSVTYPSSIRIKKIGVYAPINWDIPGGDATVPYLEKGVAHLKGSAEPGENGNLFLTGHSSDYIWKRNPYATVFTLLGKLVQGDAITITKDGVSYDYIVDDSKVVSPYELSVMDPTSTATITLMTCYPVGTTARRLIVTGRYVPVTLPVGPQVPR